VRLAVAAFVMFAAVPLPANAQAPDAATGAINEFALNLRHRYPGYDQWTERDLFRLGEIDDSLITGWATSEHPEWRESVPQSYNTRYGARGRIRFIQDVLDEQLRRGISVNDDTGRLLIGMVGTGLHIPAERNQMIFGTNFTVNNPQTGRRIVATPAEYYAYARDVAIQDHRDRNQRARAERARLAASPDPAERARANQFNEQLVDRMLVPVPGAATNGLIATNPTYADAIRRFVDYANMQGGFGAEVSANDAYVLGYTRASRDKINPDPNPAAVVDRVSVCRSLPAIETAIFDNQRVDVGQAYDAGELRRIVGNCDDVPGANVQPASW
jgi:hypothetical protein